MRSVCPFMMEPSTLWYAMIRSITIVLRKGGALVLGDVWQPAPARAVMNAWMPFSHEGDVRIYSETELRAILGTWFQRVRWSRIGLTGCLVVASKG